MPHIERITRPHHVGRSIAVTLDPNHIRSLGIDDLTYFRQIAVKEGILLEMHKFDISAPALALATSSATANRLS
jgi:hypothetical protein